MAGKTNNGDEKRQKHYTVPNTDEVYELVASVTNKYARAVVALNPTDDNGPMDAGMTDSALFTSALGALNERLDPEKPKEIVDFIDHFKNKKKRGPQVHRKAGDTDGSAPQRKRVISASEPDSSKRSLLLSQK